MQRLLERARERKLDRVGATYAVTAWVVVQAASATLSAFGMPAASMRWLLLALFTGFPVALLWAWVTGRNNEGGTVKPPEAVALREWLPFGVAAIVAILLALQGATGIFWGPKRPLTTRHSAQIAASLAVLPFENLSGDPKKAYFSDGIADQLISELARIPPLRVAARSSSFAFRGKDVNVKTVANALNVRSVLEGSVREAGNRVRIAAELVDANTGFQVWSDSYDRNLTDILALQDDIAGAIAGAMRKRFGGAPLKTGKHAPRPEQIDPEAYKLFLQGKYYLAQGTREGAMRAVSLFAGASELAPNYADAFAWLAQARSGYALDYSDAASAATALQNVKTALSLDPANATALMARVRISLVQWRWRDAAKDIHRLQKLHVNSAGAWLTRAIFFDYVGLPQFTGPALEKAAQLDPLSTIDRFNLVLYWIRLRNWDAATRAAAAAAALQPGDPHLLARQCEIGLGQGRAREARRIASELSARTGIDAAGAAAFCRFYIAVAGKDFATARKIVDAAAAAFPASGVSAVELANGYAMSGDTDSAMKWFRRAFVSRDPQMLIVLPVPFGAEGLQKLYADPRWKALRAAPEVRDWEQARREIAAEFQASE